LSNAEKKARYDKFGHAGMNGSSSAYSNVDFDLNTIFERFGDLFEEVLAVFLVLEEVGFGSGNAKDRKEFVRELT
jgi:molecular chaperone DnaJ